MSINTYIVDDENFARERLIYLLQEFLNGELNIIGQSDKAENALNGIIQSAPDLVFLDVEMPQMSGLELAEKLQVRGFNGKIIFVTAFDHYTIKAIRANAFDYIQKPVDVDELRKAVERFKNEICCKFNTAVIKQFELSERETELIQYLDKGLSSEEIAEKMFLSKHTVDTHRRNILLKTGARNTVELLNLLKN